MKAKAKHRSHSIEFKRQFVQAYLAGETLHGLTAVAACYTTPGGTTYGLTPSRHPACSDHRSHGVGASPLPMHSMNGRSLKLASNRPYPVSPIRIKIVRSKEP
jgi:hypothetical protein